MRLQSTLKTRLTCTLALYMAASLHSAAAHAVAAETDIDFNRQIRSILSNNCFQCHGPDPAERKGGTDGLALDSLQGATVDLGGYQAIVPRHPEQSELVVRITSSDPDLQMPPRSSGKKLTAAEIDLLKKWIQQGAKYTQHWSYVKPVRPELPHVNRDEWPRNDLDMFVLAKLEQTGFSPSPQADRETLARRVCLDLTGLPPTPQQLQTFLQDSASGAYERYVDRLLQEPAFGEHWARMWLDLARYADSAGYADDPERTIWLYRDYVIRSFNENKPFDQFTIEQLAGDLLPNPTADQMIATAFHRNTLTNNEGGTNDEEFRNVAVVDRVNTTLSVWMGTTIACAQCHTHKFDPITQAEYFSLFAIFNNTADHDQRDEAPLFSLYSTKQIEQQKQLKVRIADAQKELQQPTPELEKLQIEWDTQFPRDLYWNRLTPGSVTTASGSAVSQDGSVISVAAGAGQDTYQINVPLESQQLRAIQIQTLPHESLPANGPGHANGNFVITRVTGEIAAAPGSPIMGQFVRIELPGKEKFLSLAEVQVFQADTNIAAQGTATQISAAYEGVAQRAIDGTTNGAYFEGNSVTHTAAETDPWWELDLHSEQPVDRLVIWNRTDGNVGTRLAHFRVSILNANRQTVWTQVIENPPAPSVELRVNAPRSIDFAFAVADYSQNGFPASSVISKPTPQSKGWAISDQQGRPHAITLLTREPMDLLAGSVLHLTIEQNSAHQGHTLGRFQIRSTADRRAEQLSQTPAGVLAILNLPAEQRTGEQRETLQSYFLQITPHLNAKRQQLEQLNKELSNIKPNTVPVCAELPADQRRITRIQLRGNYLQLGDEVHPGTPAAFPPLPASFQPNRLGLAHWLISEDNPLTARVVSNLLWEQIFGIGLVATSEDFGSQGEPPSHPELLDWLATELVQSHWDVKALLKLMVTSATYQQSARVTEEMFQSDPDNRMLARGPRFRLSAEMIRDQALTLAGLKSSKMFGPPVKPLQPATGLNAAFGSAVDWKTSEGEDRFRRGIYTSWRRSNPYPSMTTFDAPNREVCTIRRVRTNTPLQALVTMNDPVFIEAAQGLARRVVRDGGSTQEERCNFIWQLCLARKPDTNELARMMRLYEETHKHFSQHADQAKEMATVPLGPLPEKMETVELATWTVLSNVVLNLDELLMKP